MTIVTELSLDIHLARLFPIDSHMPRLDGVSIGCEFNKAALVPRPVSQGRRPPVSTSLSRLSDDRLRAHATYNTAVPRPLTILARFPGECAPLSSLERSFSICVRLLYVARSLALALFLFLYRVTCKTRLWEIVSCEHNFRKIRHLNPNSPTTELFCFLNFKQHTILILFLYKIRLIMY